MNRALWIVQGLLAPLFLFAGSTKFIMRKIVAGLFTSVDGVIGSPADWHFPYFDDDLGQAIGTLMAAADTMLLGRVTYQEFADYWPNQDSSVEPADYMNNTPKLVV